MAEETLLLVEDEEIVRRMTREILETHGYTVIEARHGVEAIEVSRQYQQPIHLLLTDIVMPQMSGSELARNISGTRPEIKVLYMSGYRDRDIVERGGELASDLWFLEKPFTPDALLQRIRQVLIDENAPH